MTYDICYYYYYYSFFVIIPSTVIGLFISKQQWGFAAGRPYVCRRQQKPTCNEAIEVAGFYIFVISIQNIYIRLFQIMYMN